MSERSESAYERAGVLPIGGSERQQQFSRLLRATFAYCGSVGRPVMDLGYFANVIDLGNGMGMAISTDGVGTKTIIAQLMERYDTIGIDCVAMNVNDLLCVGARPLALVDYIALARYDEEVMVELAKGLAEGARQAGISIPGGETAQLGDLIMGGPNERGFDLVGTCIGLVTLAHLMTGDRLAAGDAVIGLASTGVHSNGMTLARRICFSEQGWDVGRRLDELGRTLGEELLEPTAIYVQEALSLLDSGVDVKAYLNITGDGFLNLARVPAAVGFVLDALPEPPPVFPLLQRAGGISDAEMHSVFNMGVGFCAVVAEGDADLALELLKERGRGCWRIGTVVADPERRVRIPAKNLVSEGKHFR
ncbi:MAG: phosphoribosylformylglycinamidine cyclo-ligase [Candidatus Tectomicrobia bacterium]|nr:phosphoribosylformylglycinamidine cyclo-ligase [Candidatus Tectomicrobia bacterium]